MLPALEALGVEDRNHDDVADFLNTRIYVANIPTAADLAAAANIAARLAFETTSINLPIGFRASAFEPGDHRAILVGPGTNQIADTGAVRLASAAEAEIFARSIGLADYTSSEPDSEVAHRLPLNLSRLLQRTKQIILARDVSSTAVIDLAARIGLESTELHLPLVVVAEDTAMPPPDNSLLVGLSNPYVQQLIRERNFDPQFAPGEGRISIVGSFAVIAGGDGTGEAEALHYASLRMPFIGDYEKGQPSLGSIENAVRRYTPAPKPETELSLDETLDLQWEVEDALQRIYGLVLPAIRQGDVVELDLRLSEPPEIRRDLAVELRRLFAEVGANLSSIRVLDAHKQGFSWIDEEIKPGLKNATSVRILYRELECDAEALDAPDRWLHELYPIDEILARDLGLPTENITFGRVAASAPHDYDLIAQDATGRTLLHSTFDSCYVDRTLFDVFPQYARARVATGWIRVRVNDLTILDERIKTDYERFWDEYQKFLPKIRDYVLRLHGGKPRVESAPHFEELSVDVELSESNYRIGIDEERISTLEALHEDIYFETLLFFDLLGSATCGKPLKYPGRIIPRVRAARPGAGRARVRLVGYRSPFCPDMPFADQDPMVRTITVQNGRISVEVSAGTDFCWLPDKTDEVDGPEHPTPTTLRVNQPIGPTECAQIIAGLQSHPEIHPFLAGKSWLGHSVWAMDVMLPVEGKYFSEAKASSMKPCLFVTGRQHANEVSSTTHILKLAELLATDPECRRLLERVNFVLQPITNPDGAALVDELHRATPGFMLHAGYFAALGVDVTDQQWSAAPKYPEARIRADLWRMWQPDIVLNPHGYPSHEWVQLFAGYTAWVRSKRFRARDWWIPRGWFMPHFEVIEDERFPDHRAAAMNLADRIAAAISETVGPMNERMHRRYAKYMGLKLEPHKGVLIHKTAAAVGPDAFGFMSRHPEITFFEGLSEAPDEVATGQWMEMLVAAGLQFSLVHARFLAENPGRVVRTQDPNDAGIVLRISRHRLLRE